MRILKSTFSLLFIFSFYCCCSQDKQDTVSIHSNHNPVLRDTMLPYADSAVQSDQFDTAMYDLKMKELANGDKSHRWPPKASYPNAGAVLPFKRVVAYYGNFYSTRMGVLGQYPPKQMLERLQSAVKEWQKADSVTPVVPALHYIAVTAQQFPGAGEKYRLRMPYKEIDKAIELAAQVNGLVILDIQVGLSTLEEEIPALKKYLLLPQVHLGIDPEFSMKNGKVPGKTIGTFDAADINFASAYLAKLVKENNLPPKILVVHRFTNAMVTNYKNIITRPEVQVVMDMDGWGSPARKKNTYTQCIYYEPVQFTGFKLFYKNDLKENGHLMTPAEVLKLKPQPIYIQYQ